MLNEKKDQETQELTGDGLGDASGPSPFQEADNDAAPADGGARAAESLRDEMAELNNRLVRAQADFENYRRRVAREREELAAYANQKLILGLLPVLDNLERALATSQVDGDEKLRQGLELTARSFRDLLAKEGVTGIDAVGQPFDPYVHEAVMTVDSDEHEDGTVVAEFQKGYKLGERVIRPSMVQVSKKG